jgi:hypothetical protein
MCPKWVFAGLALGLWGLGSFTENRLTGEKGVGMNAIALVAMGLAGLVQSGPNGVWDGFGHDDNAAYAFNPLTVETPSPGVKTVSLKTTFNKLMTLKGLTAPAASMVQRLTIQCSAHTYQVHTVVYYDASGTELTSRVETGAPSATSGDGASGALANKVCS